MIPSEFKAWFEGYTEDIDGPPSANQWAKIQARIKDIDGTAITQRVYLDRYRYLEWPYIPGPVTFGGTTYTGTSNQTVDIPSVFPASFNSSAAMFALGKDEFAASQNTA